MSCEGGGSEKGLPLFKILLLASVKNPTFLSYVRLSMLFKNTEQRSLLGRDMMVVRQQIDKHSRKTTNKLLVTAMDRQRHRDRSGDLKFWLGFGQITSRSCLCFHPLIHYWHKCLTEDKAKKERN